MIFKIDLSRFFAVSYERITRMKNVKNFIKAKI